MKKGSYQYWIYAGLAGFGIIFWIFLARMVLSGWGFSAWDGSSQYLPVDSQDWLELKKFGFDATESADTALKPFNDSVLEEPSVAVVIDGSSTPSLRLGFFGFYDDIHSTSTDAASSTFILSVNLLNGKINDDIRKFNTTSSADVFVRTLYEGIGTTLTETRSADLAEIVKNAVNPNFEKELVEFTTRQETYIQEVLNNQATNSSGTYSVSVSPYKFITYYPDPYGAEQYSDIEYDLTVTNPKIDDPNHLWICSISLSYTPWNTVMNSLSVCDQPLQNIVINSAQYIPLYFHNSTNWFFSTPPYRQDNYQNN